MTKKTLKKRTLRKGSERIVVRALRTHQGKNVAVFSFFLQGSDVLRVADLSRISRDEKSELRGFQRKEIKNHVRSIVNYLESGPVLFPNAIILALSPEVRFVQSRGPSPEGLAEIAQSGTLTIPVRPAGHQVAWIVDGQQRSLALSQAKNSNISVPIVGFISGELETQREQFILVNKAKPLPTRLISELLPEVSALLPRDLANRKIPSELVNVLNRDPKSPFYQLIKRESEPKSKKAVIIDSAIIEAIKRNLRPPLGALSQYRGAEETDTDAMYQALVVYWSAIKDAFKDAWGKPPTESRLMHSAGILSMGALMDQVMLRADSSNNPVLEVRDSMKRLQAHCSWVDGSWEALGWKWNEVQNTSQHISRLSEHLMRLDRDLARASR